MSETKKIYLAGPMRGIPEFNFPAFFRNAKRLRRQGFEVFNPAQRDIDRAEGVDVSIGNAEGDEAVAKATYGFDLRAALKDDTAFICEHATHIAMLPGWEKSTGAVAEHALARALGLQFIYLPEGS